MQFTNLANLKNNTCKIITTVEKGNDAIITRHGKPVAVISHLKESELEDFILTHHPKFKKTIELAYNGSLKHKGKDMQKLIKELEDKI